MKIICDELISLHKEKISHWLADFCTRLYKMFPNVRMQWNKAAPSHQWRVASIVSHRARCCRVHITKKTFNLPQGHASSSVWHLEQSGLFQSRSKSCNYLQQGLISLRTIAPSRTVRGKLAFMVRSSSPRETRSLIGGRYVLFSWVSTVALIAFCQSRFERI